MFLKKQLNTSTSIFPLAIYRMAFGFLMCISLIRFMLKGWVEDCYLDPEFHFTYQFFEWIHPVDSVFGMYSIVILCAISALCIGLGFLYRIATIVFFVSFSYLELIEQSWYLNHYYFVSIIAFLLCFIPANKGYSLDVIRNKGLKNYSVPAWTVFILKLQISVVYFMAGIAKIKSDWLLEAMPLKIWLKAKTDIPIIGELFQYDFTAYVFSYFGLFYDLLIPFLLWNKKTRPFAFVAIVVFHVFTALLFNIGMFPWIMIAGSSIFISVEIWNKVLNNRIKIPVISTKSFRSQIPIVTKYILIVFFIVQILFPLRHFLYNENVLWTERNYRFSWNVMLMEKSGYAKFVVTDKNSTKIWQEYPKNYLTDIQEKQMSFQPDMIWQFANYLEKKYNDLGFEVEVKTESYVTLNGRPSKLYISKDVNLLNLSRNEIYDYVLQD